MSIEPSPNTEQELVASPVFSPHLTVSRSMPATSIAWYPFMDAYQDPSNCCFLVGSTDHPLHLIDCLTGERILSYHQSPGAVHWSNLHHISPGGEDGKNALHLASSVV
ncbi:hypothetical protein DSO57_1012372 [Entomophthora muscae]|uniref:Uncharacterized protein n=1 Tax=Entomophthora muscae TaxID=34485 RepID=A0ACC2TGW7_9FUNG|nr:hypothetical protein DSO57_1012372 [Entomophthora muscae]